MELLFLAIGALICVANCSEISREDGELGNRADDDNNSNREDDHGSNRRANQGPADKGWMDDKNKSSEYKGTNVQSALPAAAVPRREAVSRYQHSYIITRSDQHGIVDSSSVWLGPVFCDEQSFAYGYKIYQDGSSGDPKGVTAIKLFCKKNPDHEQSRNTIITGEVLGSSTEVKYCLNKGPDEYHISPQSADQFITGAEGVFFAGEGAISFYPICDIPDEGTRNVAVDSTKYTAMDYACRRGTTCSISRPRNFPGQYWCQVQDEPSWLWFACCRPGHACAKRNENYLWCYIDDESKAWRRCEKSIHNVGMPWRKMLETDLPGYELHKNEVPLPPRDQKNCPVGHAICGIDSRVDGQNAGSNKSGIQEIKIFCCEVPYVIDADEETTDETTEGTTDETTEGTTGETTEGTTDETTEGTTGGE